MFGKNSFLKTALSLSILLVVFVSGCVSDGNTIAFGNGVVIQGWEADFSSLESGETIKFFLKLQNQGESLAENIEATVIGIDSKEWDFSRDPDFDDLVAPDRTTNTPGEVVTHYYDGEAPELPSGTTFTYEPIMRVSYDYTTNANKPITVVDIEELRRIMQQGKSIETESTVYTSGPISIEIRTGDYIKTQNEDPEFPLYIVVTNTLWESGGTVIESRSAPRNYDYPIKLDVDISSGGKVTCNTDGGWIDLWQGKTAEITCELNVDPAPEGTRLERLITADLNYRFQTDATTAVSVTG